MHVQAAELGAAVQLREHLAGVEQALGIEGAFQALLLGEVGGRDLHLKGSGRTPFARGAADGRAALGPMLREYLVSEAMHALGIPTTRSLAVLTTGEAVQREVDLPGGG